MFYDIDLLKDTNPVLLAVWPAALSVVAFLIWYLGYRKEETGDKAPWKWLALLFLAASLAIGASALILVFSGDYALVYDQLGRRVRYALYVAGALPIAGLAAIIGLSVFQRLNNAQRF